MHECGLTPSKRKANADRRLINHACSLCFLNMFILHTPCVLLRFIILLKRRPALNCFDSMLIRELVRVSCLQIYLFASALNTYIYRARRIIFICERALCVNTIYIRTHKGESNLFGLSDTPNENRGGK